AAGAGAEVAGTAASIRSTASRPVMPTRTPNDSALGVTPTMRASKRASGSVSGQAGGPLAMAMAWVNSAGRAQGWVAQAARPGGGGMEQYWPFFQRWVNPMGWAVAKVRVRWVGRGRSSDIVRPPRVEAAKPRQTGPHRLGAFLRLASRSILYRETEKEAG